MLRDKETGIEQREVENYGKLVVGVITKQQHLNIC